MLILTKSFVDDVWYKISGESILMRTIYDKKKNWRVVPVYTMRRLDCDFRIPLGINALKGINYFEKDKFYQDSVVSLIENTVQERKDKE